GSIEYALLSENDPERMALGAGEKGTLGDWEVEVVNVGDASATVKLINSQTNEEVEKELGPLNDETTTRIPTDQNQRSQFILRPESNQVQIMLDILNDPFGEADKVKLVGYTDVIQLDNGALWPQDERFIYRPDT
ncbi:MAG: hypothetical protein QM287_05125, partial [Bacillota bacterium]|nr:hypothetical protein [Bacillota bacterium]